MSKEKFNLQLFAEGAAAEGEGTVEGTVDDGQNVTIGEPETEGSGVQEEGESFDDLIKGKYKKEYSASVESIVKGRVSKLAPAADNWKQAQPLLEGLYERYGVEPGNLEKLSEAIDLDDAHLEDEALERGMDVDTLKHVKQIERQNKQMAQTIAEIDRDREVKDAWNKIMSQIPEVQETYPNFDIEEEMENPEFAELLSANVSLKNAYQIIHMDEIQATMMAKVAQQTAQNVASTVRANKRRPSEGAGSSAPSTMKRNPNSYSDEEREDIYRRVMRGEDVLP